jgi:acetylornithine deacetylase
MSEDDGLVALLSSLVACDSTNPSLQPGAPGESAVAELVAARLRAAGLEVTVWEAIDGRAGVLGVLRGTGDGPRLLLLSHLDVVAASPPAFAPRVADGRMYGRGTCDMKAGLAATIVAVERLAAGPAPAGDVLVAGVIDEEWLSAGAIELVDRLDGLGLRPDGAILPEATGLDAIVEHGGFAWWEVTSTGREAAGDDPVGGIDAIALLGGVLDRIIDLDDALAARVAKPYGRPCLHASTVAGGLQLSAYPASATVGIERCLVPGETVAGARAELERALDDARAARPALDVALHEIVGREAVELAADEPVVDALRSAFAAVRGRPVIVRGDMGWMDSGILVEAGIPCVAFGPTGAGEHTEDEWVDLASVAACADVVEATARAFCSGRRGRERDRNA